MARPTRLIIDRQALIHNLNRVKQLAPGRQVIAMVKANAYGCGIEQVVPVFDGAVDAFGVACIEEAEAIRQLGSLSEIILFQGIFEPNELAQALRADLTLVLHHEQQLHWLVAHSIPSPRKLWVKVNTGMNRLGFPPSDVGLLLKRLKSVFPQCKIGLMTHFACADDQHHPQNNQQTERFQHLMRTLEVDLFSAANSALIFNCPQLHLDVVRPGIMLYGISPFADHCAYQLGLKPVMRLVSAISSIQTVAPGDSIGYGASWTCHKPGRIAVVPVGYGDGYPRHLNQDARVYFHQREVAVCGRVSMDMLTIDISDCPEAQLNDTVELWGEHMPIERVAQASGTIAYELAVQVSNRTRTYG